MMESRAGCKGSVFYITITLCARHCINVQYVICMNHNESLKRSKGTTNEIF